MAAGVGLRSATPVGPLRVDLALRIPTQWGGGRSWAEGLPPLRGLPEGQNEPVWTFHVSLGDSLLSALPGRPPALGREPGRVPQPIPAHEGERVGPEPAPLRDGRGGLVLVLAAGGGVRAPSRVRESVVCRTSSEVLRMADAGEGLDPTGFVSGCRG